MKTALVILILLAVGAALFFTTRQKGIASADNETYAKLKAMPPVAKNFETPEGAILCLEDAYRRKDIEAAVAAKDFKQAMTEFPDTMDWYQIPTPVLQYIMRYQFSLLPEAEAIYRQVLAVAPQDGWQPLCFRAHLMLQ